MYRVMTADQFKQRYVMHTQSFRYTTSAFRTINLGLKMQLYDGKIVYPILVMENYNFEMSKKGVLGFSIS